MKFKEYILEISPVVKPEDKITATVLPNNYRELGKLSRKKVIVRKHGNFNNYKILEPEEFNNQIVHGSMLKFGEQGELNLDL